MSSHTIPRTSQAIWLEFQENRSIKLRDQIAKANDGLVFKVANKWARKCPEPVEDLAQIGHIGLLSAIDKFDPAKNIAFSSFAVPYIQGAIQHHLRAHWGSIKIPQRAFEDASKVRRLQRQMAKLGRQVTAEQAAAAVGISGARWAWIDDAVQRKQLATLDEVAEVADLSEAGLSEAHYSVESLLQAVATLPSLERQCVTARYFKALDDAAIGRLVGCAADKVAQLIDVSLDQLRGALNA